MSELTSEQIRLDRLGETLHPSGKRATSWLVCSCGLLYADDDASDNESCHIEGCGRFKQRMEWATEKDIAEAYLALAREHDALRQLADSQVTQLDLAQRVAASYAATIGKMQAEHDALRKRLGPILTELFLIAASYKRQTQVLLPYATNADEMRELIKRIDTALAAADELTAALEQKGG